jgi:hypothetical protein
LTFSACWKDPNVGAACNAFPLNWSNTPLTFDTSTKTFSGNAKDGIDSRDAAVRYEVVVTITDGIMAPVSQNFYLRVDNLPKLGSTTLPDRAAKEGHPLTIKFPLSTFIDDDLGDTSAALTVVATKINGDALPTWISALSIVGTDYVMTGTPGFTDKDFTVLLTVTDLAASGAGIFTTSFNIGIGHNISPEFREQLPDVYKQIGEPLLITISTTVCVDDDGDVLSFQIMLANGAAPPSWMTVSGVNNNIISGTPQDGDLGDFELALRCVDEVLAFDEQYFHVIVNSPPVVNEQVPNQ